MIVTGTPGVGKSTILLYVLFKAKERKRDMIAQIGERAYVFLSSQSTGLSADARYTFLEESEKKYASV